MIGEFLEKSKSEGRKGMSVLIGIDIGGTFTDIAALNEDTG